MLQGRPGSRASPERCSRELSHPLPPRCPHCVCWAGDGSAGSRRAVVSKHVPLPTVRAVSVSNWNPAPGACSGPSQRFPSTCPCPGHWLSPGPAQPGTQSLPGCALSPFCPVAITQGGRAQPRAPQQLALSLGLSFLAWNSRDLSYGTLQPLSLSKTDGKVSFERK